MTAPVTLSLIHHVAYRCRDAAETVEWYQRVLGMRFTTGVHHRVFWHRHFASLQTLL